MVLGFQAAAVSLDQAAGSMAAGLLFALPAIQISALEFAAVVVLIGTFASRSMSALLGTVWRSCHDNAELEEALERRAVPR